MRILDALESSRDCCRLLQDQFTSKTVSAESRLSIDPIRGHVLAAIKDPNLRTVLWRPPLFKAAITGAEVFTSANLDFDRVVPTLAVWVFEKPISAPVGMVSDLDIQDCDPVLRWIITIPLAPEHTAGKTGGMLFLAAFVAERTRPGDLMPRAQVVYSWSMFGSPIARDYEFIAAASAFLCQPFIEFSPGSDNTDRPERRRAIKLKLDLKTCSVVCLRRRKFEGKSEDGGSEREYSCQWTVRSHWRRPSPNMKEPRPVFVHPYLKGPPDKPLRVKGPLYVVSR